MIRRILFLSMILLLLTSVAGVRAASNVVILVVDSFNNQALGLDMQQLYKASSDIILQTLTQLEPDDDGSNGNMVREAIDQAHQNEYIGIAIDNALNSLNIPSDSKENCVINTEGQVHATIGMGNGIPGIPHGQLVYDVFSELEYYYNFLASSNITLVPIDTKGFKTSIIANSIAAAMTDPSATYILNMSFAIVPCSTLRDWFEYLALRSPLDGPNGEYEYYLFLLNLEKLINSGVYSGPTDEQTYRQFYIHLWENLGSRISTAINNAPSEEYLSTDPLRQFLANPPAKVVATAAAGNFDYHFPLYPAALTDVISVSATCCDAWVSELSSMEAVGDASILFQKQDSYIFGNWGEIAMPGDQVYPNTRPWFTDATGNPITDSNGDPIRLTVNGSSFAAPRLAYVIAAFIAQDPSNACFANARPGIAYVAESDWSSVTETSVNLSLDDITARYCPDFQQFLRNNNIY